MGAIGLVGGMSWHSSALYYRRLNEVSEARHGNHMNAASVMVTLPFAPLVAAMGQGDLDTIARSVSEAAIQLENSGAVCVLLTAFTAHFCADRVKDAVAIPLLHAGDGLALACKHQGFERVGLLGTAFTLRTQHVERRMHAQGLEVVQPSLETAKRIDHCIGAELTLGAVSVQAKALFDAAVQELAENGAQVAALACTELPLFLPRRTPIPIIDGVAAHVAYALDEMTKSE